MPRPAVGSRRISRPRHFRTSGVTPPPPTARRHRRIYRARAGVGQTCTRPQVTRETNRARPREAQTSHDSRTRVRRGGQDHGSKHGDRASADLRAHRPHNQRRPGPAIAKPEASASSSQRITLSPGCTLKLVGGYVSPTSARCGPGPRVWPLPVVAHRSGSSYVRHALPDHRQQKVSKAATNGERPAATVAFTGPDHKTARR